ncbi:MAG TPA: FecR domain-containing protein [Planctomycetota bacterium]|nr:FecR domain-containing protein [Planctomycetota bacterium]
MINEEQIERQLKASTGPVPRPETLEAILARVRNGEVSRSTHVDIPTTQVAASDAAANASGPRVFLAQAPQRGWRMRHTLAAAAILLVLLGWQFLSVQKPPVIGFAQSEGLLVTRDGAQHTLVSDEPLYANDSVLAKKRADIRLTDGSSVRLDQNTTLKIAAVEPDERVRLQVTVGRIFLRVAKATGRFRVQAGATHIEVLGTVFGVSVSKDSATTSVYEGQVRMEAPAGRLELGRGDSGLASGDSAPTRTDIDPAIALAWARDWTRFQNRPLGEVLNWIETNSAFRFTAAGEIRQQPVTIAIDQEPMIRVVETLMLSLNLRYSARDNDVTILGAN